MCSEDLAAFVKDMVRAESSVLEKAEEPEIKWPKSTGSQKKQENSGKTSTSAYLTTLKPLTVWSITKSGKFLEMGIPDHLTYLLRNLYEGYEAIVTTRHGTMNWFKIGKGVRQRLYIVNAAYLTHMQSTSWEVPAWMTHKLESRLLGEIPTTSDMQMIPL